MTTPESLNADALLTPDVVDAAGVATRCPVNPLAVGAATQAEHPAQPPKTAAAVTTLWRGAMVYETKLKQRAL